ncbi:MAG: hypothetical protein AAGF23_12130 [Acidobacteriota bacterium]
MPLLTILYGAALILIGAVGYFATGAASATALIPAFFGLPLAILGMLARSEKFLKHAMHGAAMIALLATFGTVRGFFKMLTMITGAEVERPAAVLSQGVVALLSVIFLVFCIRSFIAARRAREAAA